MPSERDPAVEALIRDGRQAYAAKRYKNALESFTRAMKRCPCTRGVRRERCSCKHYEQVAAEGGSIFNEAMYTCTCSVGKTFSKCDNSLHIQALDYRAATFEALKEFDRARKDAEWLLELAPRLPDGYLRLGKVSRLQKKNEFAWKVFNAGIDASISNNLPKSDPKTEKLYAARAPLHARYFRQDPLQLPLDIVYIIFSYIDFLSLLRCLRVCKSWRKSLGSSLYRHLWRTLTFPRPLPRRNPPSTHALSKLLGYSGNDARKLIIKDAAGLRLTNSKLKLLLRGSPRLEHLDFRKEYESLDIHPQQWPRTITHLVLDEANPPPGLWDAVASKLVYLHITAVAQTAATARELPLLPNLRYLRATGCRAMLMLTQAAQATPNLEQLWYNDIFPPLWDGPQDPLGESWKQLKVVICGGLSESLRASEAFAVVQSLSVNQGNNMRHIEVMPFHEDRSGATLLGQEQSWMSLIAFLSRGEWQAGQPNSFDNLRSLHLKRAVMDGAASEPLLRKAIDNDKLRSIDINFRRPGINDTEGPASCQRIAEFSWLRGAESIRSIGLSNFRFRRYPETDEDLPLPSFLASFPNLETLEIGSEYYDDAELCSVIFAIMKATKLRKIYQTTIKGANLDTLRTAAKEFGVELVWGERQREWPVPLDG